MNHGQDYATLLPELIEKISGYLLADDVVDYICFRAVCHNWRFHTTSPCSFANCFRPHKWLTAEICNIATSHCFYNYSSSRFLFITLPEFESHHVISCGNGLLVLVDMENTCLVRLLNPFTRQLSAYFPPIRAGTPSRKSDSDPYSYKFEVMDGECPELMMNKPWPCVSKPGGIKWKKIIKSIRKEENGSNFALDELLVSNSTWFYC